MKTSESIKEIIKAIDGLPQFQIFKNADNPYFKSKYADLNEILSVISEPCKKAGLTIIQEAPLINGIITVVTRIVHVSGEWIETETGVPADKQGKFDAQTAGSAITYGRRYALNALFNLSAEDDDGNKASGKQDLNNVDSLMASLPADIKQIFKDRKATKKYVSDFCIMRGWDNDSIRSALSIPNEGLPEGFND